MTSLLERGQPLRVQVRGSGDMVAERVALASAFLPRLVGLMGRRRLDPLDGLWLEPGGTVHTFAMRFAIDVAFLDRAFRVLAVRARVPPGRIRVAPTATRVTLELPPGRAAACGLASGTSLTARPR